MAKLILQEDSPGMDMGRHLKLKSFGYVHDPGVSDEKLDVFRHPSGKVVGIVHDKHGSGFFHTNNEDEAWNDPPIKSMDHLHSSLEKHHGSK
jgi:hypothetical protein